MLKNIKLILAIGMGVSIFSLIPVTAQANTINYGSIARDEDYHGVYVHFRFNKKHTQKYAVTPNGDFRFRVVYDTKIKNNSKKSV